jgi:Mce-associated membrane protein
MRRGRGWWVLVVVLAVGTVAALGLGLWQMTEKSRAAPVLVADQAAARDEVMQFVSVNMERLLSYTPRTDDTDVADMASVLSGKAADAYRDDMRTKLAVARTNGVTQTSTIRQTAVETLSDDTAEVLAFVDQTVASTGNQTKTQSAYALRVTLRKGDGAWMIENFEPL